MKISASMVTLDKASGHLDQQLILPFYSDQTPEQRDNNSSNNSNNDNSNNDNNQIDRDNNECHFQRKKIEYR